MLICLNLSGWYATSVLKWIKNKKPHQLLIIIFLVPIFFFLFLTSYFNILTIFLFNTAVMSFYIKVPNVIAQFVVAAVTWYFHSIECAVNAKGDDDSLQDILRLLTLWYNHGSTASSNGSTEFRFYFLNIIILVSCNFLLTKQNFFLALHVNLF